MTTVTLSLISHTNVGKTTLARTLLRRDVGEVRDQAHVTEVSEAHLLIETGNARLQLWDTPGFGDTRRLMRRLRHERDPLGWFLHQVWDRMSDRPLWCGQQAVRNVKREADVVLYLVNAAEEPAETGYVALELELLAWIDRPVVILLNQTGPGGERLEETWREFTADIPIVRDVLSLDAFARCWTEETLLLERVAPLLEGAERAALDELTAAWNARNVAAFRECCKHIGAYLGRAAADRETAEGAKAPDSTLSRLAGAVRFRAVDQRRAMAALDRRLDDATTELMRSMISANGLEGESAAKIEQRVQDFEVKGGAAFDERSGAVAGAVVSGAIGGLAADVLSGGLSLGGGVIAGGILGALGGSALAKGYRWLGGDEQPSVSFTTEFLDRLAQQTILRYLAVAHHGRGRGRYRDLEQPASWSAAVEKAIGKERSSLAAIWSSAGRDEPASRPGTLPEIIERIVADALCRMHPRAAALLLRTP